MHYFFTCCYCSFSFLFLLHFLDLFLYNFYLNLLLNLSPPSMSFFHAILYTPLFFVIYYFKFIFVFMPFAYEFMFVIPFCFTDLSRKCFLQPSRIARSSRTFSRYQCERVIAGAVVNLMSSVCPIKPVWPRSQKAIYQFCLHSASVKCYVNVQIITDRSARVVITSQEDLSRL